jgi:hypothetical protein
MKDKEGKNIGLFSGSSLMSKRSLLHKFMGKHGNAA